MIKILQTMNVTYILTEIIFIAIVCFSSRYLFYSTSCNWSEGKNKVGIVFLIFISLRLGFGFLGIIIEIIK